MIFLIVPNFQKLCRKQKSEQLLCREYIYKKNNLDFSEDVKHFADLGFKQMSIEPVVGPEEDPYSIREEDLPKIMEEYDKLALEYIKREKEGKRL